MTVHVFSGSADYLSTGGRTYERTRTTNPDKEAARQEAGTIVRTRRPVKAAAIVPEPNPDGDGIRWRIFTTTEESA